jgi:FAS-associated factor 2
LDEVLRIFEAAIQNHGAYLIQARMDREEREAARRLREEQDLAYQESLRKDREKQLIQKEKEKEERRLRADEEDKRRKEQEIKDEKKRYQEMRIATLRPEPTSGDLTKIVFRLPDGSRSERKFLAEDTLEELYHFIDTQELHIESDNYVLCSNYPRKVFADRSSSVKDAGLFPNGMVIVEEVWEDE